MHGKSTVTFNRQDDTSHYSEMDIRTVRRFQKLYWISANSPTESPHLTAQPPLVVDWWHYTIWILHLFFLIAIFIFICFIFFVCLFLLSPKAYLAPSDFSSLLILQSVCRRRIQSFHLLLQSLTYFPQSVFNQVSIKLPYFPILKGVYAKFFEEIVLKVGPTGPRWIPE